MQKVKRQNAYDKVMGLNVRSVLQLTQLAIPHLEKTKGNVINISSIQGIKPASHAMVYSTSKAALDMLTKVSASQLGSRGIRVNSIKSVGRQVDHSVEHERKVIARQCALDRRGTTEDIANLALFLASDKAANMTGSIILSDSVVLIRNN